MARKEEPEVAFNHTATSQLTQSPFDIDRGYTRPYCTRTLVEQRETKKNGLHGWEWVSTGPPCKTYLRFHLRGFWYCPKCETKYDFETRNKIES